MRDNSFCSTVSFVRCRVRDQELFVAQGRSGCITESVESSGR